MQKYEVRDGFQRCVDVLFVDIVLVALDIGDSGRVLLTCIEWEEFLPENVLFQVIL